MPDKRRCRELLGSLSNYIDGEASQALCAEIERHLADCEDCQVVVNTLRKTIELYRERASGEGMPPEVRRRLVRSLGLEDYLPE
jgi:anti-sigma factor RsiW